MEKQRYWNAKCDRSLYFPMDLASGKIELSERYIQKLKCGHTLQSYNAVVLWRNNGIGTPSVTAVNVYIFFSVMVLIA